MGKLLKEAPESIKKIEITYEQSSTNDVLVVKQDGKVFGWIHKEEYNMMKKWGVIQDALMPLSWVFGITIKPSQELYDEWFKLDIKDIKPTIKEWIKNNILSY